MEETPTDAFRRLQEFLEQMIRESMEQGNFRAAPAGFAIVIRGTGPFPGPGAAPDRVDGEPAIEVHDGEEEVLVLAGLPGITGEQVRLAVEDGTLVITASDGVREFRGKADLPPVDPESLHATCRNGVLQVSLRKIPGNPG